MNNDIAKIMDGLSHPTRVNIMELLKKNENAMYLSDIVREIGSGYKSDFVSIKGHVLKMHFAGIVELTKKTGKYYVNLLKYVEIKIKNINNV